MARYARGFLVTDIAEVHLGFDRLFTTLELAQRNPATRARARIEREQLLRDYREFNREMEELALRGAADATERMRAKFKRTKRRSLTVQAPYLLNALRAKPLVTGLKLSAGAVGVADLDRLNKVTNPSSPQHGAYWRAQEFGTGQPGGPPSQLGRVIRGYFYDRGLSNPTPPVSGGGSQPIFVSARNANAAAAALGHGQFGGGTRGGFGGYGTIQREIQGRHFIRDGADLAYRDWLAGLRVIEARAVARLLFL